MRFSNPGWLAAGLSACLLLIWLWRRHDARQRAALALFVSPHLRLQLTRSASITRRRCRRGLELAALACLFCALAGPLVGFRWEQVTRRGIEIVFAVDTSRSMLTPDMRPNRLTRAKLAIDDFVQRLDGDAVGIVAFAGDAFLVCPVTLDHGAFRESLGAVDTGTIPRGGTNLSSAVREAQQALRRRGGDKVLILVTDGEDLEGSVLAAATAAARDGVKIFTVGVGTAAGDLIPLPAAEGGGYVKDDTGAFVRSRLDETVLGSVARAAGGLYVPLGEQGEGLEAVFQSIYGTATKQDLAFRQRRVYIERYQWPLAASLAAMLASLLIGSRRSGRRAATLREAAKTIATAAALASWAALPFPVRAAGVAPEEAGAAAYRGGAFPQAAQDFQQSISRAPSEGPAQLAAQEDAYYNLGNTLYRLGQKTEHTAPAETLQKWNDAVKAYETALQLRADDADSRFNRDLVKRKIDELRQNQNKDKNQDKNQNKDQNRNGGNPGAGGKNPQAPDTPPPAGPQDEHKPGDQGNENSPGSAGEAEERRAPGGMSAEEARELLDSARGDERHALGAPLSPRATGDPPQKPYRNW